MIRIKEKLFIKSISYLMVMIYLKQKGVIIRAESLKDKDIRDATYSASIKGILLF